MSEKEHTGGNTHREDCSRGGSDGSVDGVERSWAGTLLNLTSEARAGRCSVLSLVIPPRPSYSHTMFLWEQLEQGWFLSQRRFFSRQG